MIVINGKPIDQTNARAIAKRQLTAAIQDLPLYLREPHAYRGLNPAVIIRALVPEVEKCCNDYALPGLLRGKEQEYVDNV